MHNSVSHKIIFTAKSADYYCVIISYRLYERERKKKQQIYILVHAYMLVSGYKMGVCLFFLKRTAPYGNKCVYLVHRFLHGQRFLFMPIQLLLLFTFTVFIGIFSQPPKSRIRKNTHTHSVPFVITIVKSVSDVLTYGFIHF